MSDSFFYISSYNLTYTSQISGENKNEKIRVSKNVSANINKKIKLIAPLVLLTGGMIWVNQDTVKADTTPQADTVKDTDDYIATSDEYEDGRIGGVDGSEWTIDSKGVLRIGSGKWNNDSVSNFWGQLMLPDGSGKSCQAIITSVIFDGDIETGSTIDDLFSNAPSLKSVSLAPGAKLDTSNTKNFSRMFREDSSLENIDLNIFDWSSVTNSASMFEETGLKSVSMKNVNAPNLTKANSMFYDCEQLKTANFDGTTFSKNGVYLSNFISMCGVLEDVSLNNAFTGNIKKANGMFQSDFELENLDLSSMDLSNTDPDDYYLMLDMSNEASIEIKKKSITLPANANIASTEIDTYNTSIYKGWTSESLKEPITNLAEYYSEHSDIGKTTWTLAEKEKYNYTINYVDEDNDNKLIKTETKNGYIGLNADIDPVLGYVFSDDFNADDYKIESDNNKTFTVKLNDLAPYTAKVTVKYLDGHPDETFDVVVPFGMSDSASQINQTELDKYSNNNSLEKEKSYFYMGIYINDESRKLAFDQLNVYKIQGDNLKDIFNNSIDYVNSALGNASLREFSKKTLNLFEVTFAHYVKPESNNTNNNHNNNTSTDKKITTIDQKAATFNKTTALYDNDGKQISDVKLSPNSDWKNDQQMILNGTTYYRVSTNTWIKASDVYVYTDLDSKIRVHEDQRSRIKRATGELTDRALEKSTEWKTDRYTMINDQKYYRVSTNGFVNANEVDEYFD